MLNWCSKHELFEICPECMREQREDRERREWCLRMAKLEGDSPIGAGALAVDPCFENDRACGHDLQKPNCTVEIAQLAKVQRAECTVCHEVWINPTHGALAQTTPVKHEPL